MDTLGTQIKEWIKLRFTEHAPDLDFRLVREVHPPYSRTNRALIRCISFEAADALMSQYRRLCEKKEFPFMFKDASGVVHRCYMSTQKPWHVKRRNILTMKLKSWLQERCPQEEVEVVWGLCKILVQEGKRTVAKWDHRERRMVVQQSEVQDLFGPPGLR